MSSQLETLREQWDALLAQISEKMQKLREANQQQQFNEAAKDLDFWLGGVGAQLSSDEIGRDLAGTQNLLKKHQLVEADITAHEVRHCIFLFLLRQAQKAISTSVLCVGSWTP